MEKEVVVVSLGGSLINPGEINTGFLREFRKLVLAHNQRFIVVCGGGNPARMYRDACLALGVRSHFQLDIVSIQATAINAWLVQSMFGRHAYKEVVFNYNRTTNFGKVLVCCGWLPGHSTDYDAVMFARRYKAKSVINLTNVSHIFDKNPRKCEDAKHLTHILVKDYLKIVGRKFTPGMHSPFDPVAAKNIPKGIRVFVIEGLKNLKAVLDNRPFEGTEMQR